MKNLWVVLVLLLTGSVHAFAQGNPQCPTRPTGDSTNACASTAFVQTAVGGGGGGSSNWSLSGSDVYRPAGNVGIGGAPVSWGAAFKGLQNGSTAFMAVNGIIADIIGNVYWNGSVYKYLTTDTGALFAVNDTGGFGMFTFPSGTAGNTATPTRRFSLTASGALTLSGYGAGVANFDSSGLVSSKPAYTTSVTYCADLGVVANTGADQTTNLQSCINTACVGGANTIAQLPGGVIRISNEITIGDVSCIIQGTGMTDLAGFLGYTAVNNAGTRIDQLTINKNGFHHIGANAPQFRDFTITSPISGPPSSGACILTEVPNPALAVSSIGLMINRVACIGGYYCWELSEAGNAVVESSTCWAFQNSGLYNHTHTCPPQPCIDSGDSTFRDLRFISAGQPCVAGIRIYPGGGLMMSGHKFLGCSYAVYVSAAGGSTGTILLTGSSVEEQLIAGFKVDDPAPGVGIGLGQFTISNNEFLNQNGPNYQSAIEFTNSAANYIDRFNIVGNNIGISCCSGGAPIVFQSVCMEIEAGRLGTIADNVCELFNNGSFGGINIVGVASRVAVTNNSISGAIGPKYLFTVQTNFMDVGSLLSVGQLPANALPGSYAAVTDGAAPSSPCVGGGGGTAAWIGGGVWRCP